MVREEKIKEVEELKKMIEEYPVVGIIDMFKLPSKQMQQIKKKVRDSVIITMKKKSLTQLAIKNAKKENIIKIEDFIPQQPALLFTKIEPFKLYKTIEQLKSPTSAKDGDIAINDILISAGPTNLLPGPAISELSKAGIPAGVEEGKIAVKKDVVVVKKGDIIKKELAAALKKLGVEPMEVGLNIVAIYDNGKIYDKNTLNLVNSYPEKIRDAFNHAINLSVNVSYPTKENIKFLLAKAFNGAKALESKFGGAN